jgi:hypothetical protein
MAAGLIRYAPVKMGQSGPLAGTMPPYGITLSNWLVPVAGRWTG